MILLYPRYIFHDIIYSKFEIYFLKTTFLSEKILEMRMEVKESRMQLAATLNRAVFKLKK